MLCRGLGWLALGARNDVGDDSIRVVDQIWGILIGPWEPEGFEEIVYIVWEGVVRAREECASVRYRQGSGGLDASEGKERRR